LIPLRDNRENAGKLARAILGDIRLYHRPGKLAEELEEGGKLFALRVVEDLRGVWAEEVETARAAGKLPVDEPEAEGAAPAAALKPWENPGAFVQRLDRETGSTITMRDMVERRDVDTALRIYEAVVKAKSWNEERAALLALIAHLKGETSSAQGGAS
jgi:hypothetical protein